MSIAGYPSVSTSKEQLRKLVDDVFKRPSYVIERPVDTGLGKTTLKCVTLASLALAIRSSTGRHFTNSQLTERLSEIGIDVYTAYRGTQTMKVVICLPAKKRVLEQTG